MMAIKGIGHQGQRLSWQISSEPLHHAQPISRWKSSVRDFQARHPSHLSGLQSHIFAAYRFTTRNISMSMPRAVYRSSIRTSNQLKSQSNLTRARNQQSAQVCFLAGSRQAQPKLPASSNLPKQLASQLKTKRNLLTAYGQGFRLLNKALLALTKLEWEESLTQKLKSERGKQSTGSCEGIRTCNYFAPLPQVDLQLQTDLKQTTLTIIQLIKSEILEPHRFTPNSLIGSVQIVPSTNADFSSLTKSVSISIPDLTTT
ncbi:hypothetical protein F511_10711 [Dorcoceras hygrometricum]|uniref:Uncharacterized protein n=1 Tax=Dorcoceras hygrometricum TaxID=472368 RepID=A0A2Z7A9F1_9LAMI|nr:hypothetical protein F511_10711 [Dorcoceras hygrometricum]